MCKKAVPQSIRLLFLGDSHSDLQETNLEFVFLSEINEIRAKWKLRIGGNDESCFERYHMTSGYANSRQTIRFKFKMNMNVVSCSQKMSSSIKTEQSKHQLRRIFCDFYFQQSVQKHLMENWNLFAWVAIAISTDPYSILWSCVPNQRDGGSSLGLEAS